MSPDPPLIDIFATNVEGTGEKAASYRDVAKTQNIPATTSVRPKARLAEEHDDDCINRLLLHSRNNF